MYDLISILNIFLFLEYLSLEIKKKKKAPFCFIRKILRCLIVFLF